MAPNASFICAKCKKNISNKSNLTCSICKQIFHQQCTTTSDKRFFLMTKEDKDLWKCNKCVRKKPLVKNKANPRTPTTTVSKIINESVDSSDDLVIQNKSEMKSPSFINTELSSISPAVSSDNVTTRNKYKANIPVNNSYDGLTVEDDEYVSVTSISTNELRRSCPDLRSVNTIDQINQMTEKIHVLEEMLTKSEHEIDNLVSENCALKKQITKYELRIDQLSHICKSTPKKNLNTVTNNNIIDPIRSTPKPSISVFDATICLNETNNDGSIDNNADKRMTDKCTIVTKDSTIDSTLNSTHLPETSKFCLLSNNNRNKILQTVSNNKHTSNCDYCHHIIPGGGVKELLDGIGKRLQSFSRNDYCVIMIGESNFQKSENYMELVHQIRQTLIKVKNTNIIVTAPTYICGAILYNCRVEIFNSLLSQDIQTHGYAYFFDSNKHLSFEMFSAKSGKLKNNGMKCILTDLIISTTLIQNSYVAYKEIPIEDETHKLDLEDPKKQFFLL